MMYIVSLYIVKRLWRYCKKSHANKANWTKLTKRENFNLKVSFITSHSSLKRFNMSKPWNINYIKYLKTSTTEPNAPLLHHFILREKEREKYTNRISICHPVFCMRCWMLIPNSVCLALVLSPSHSLFRALCPVSFLSESLERKEGCHRDRDAYSSKEGMWLSWNILYTRRE